MNVRRIPSTVALIVGCLVAPFASNVASAGAPPGPWVFIPPPGASATTATPAPTPAPPAAPIVLTDEGFPGALRSTVVIERNKKPIALGVLLGERSVILTARSPIVVGATTGDLEIRFPELGTTVKAKMVHEDAAWDLALLVPASVKGASGVRASTTDPLAPTETLSTFVLLKTGRLQAQATAVLGKRDFLSPDGDVLKDALSVDPKTLSIGTPLIDGDGGVVAVVGRACAPGSGHSDAMAPSKAPCVPTLFGVPMQELRRFLRTAPATAKAPSAFLGVVGAPDKLGVKVSTVAASSPAERAGIKPADATGADVILSVDGQLVRTSDELGDVIKKHAPGDSVMLLVVHGTSVREVKVVLESLDEVEEHSSHSTPTISPSTVTPLPPLPVPVFRPVPIAVPMGAPKAI